MRLRFLIDESLPRWLVLAVRRRAPEIEIVRVGEHGAPPFGTSDPEIIRWAHSAGHLLMTGDLRTMPDHVAEHM